MRDEMNALDRKINHFFAMVRLFGFLRAVKKTGGN